MTKTRAKTRNNPSEATLEAVNKKELAIEDAISYIKDIDKHAVDNPNLRSAFLDIMEEFMSRKFGLLDFMWRVCRLFDKYPTLIEGFNRYLPEGYNIKCTDDAANFDIIVPSTETSSYKSSNHACAPTRTCGGSVAGISPILCFSVYLVDATCPGVNTPDGIEKETQDLKRAVTYLAAVKAQFADNPSPYQSLLEVLKDYAQERIGVCGVMWHVSCLFCKYPDLIEGFNYFLEGDYRIEYHIGNESDAYEINIQMSLLEDDMEPIKEKKPAAAQRPKRKRKQVNDRSIESGQNKRLQGDPGPSYYRLPASEAEEVCSGRDEMCKSVLNDEWACRPPRARARARSAANEGCD